jgi:hypothetical protein
MMMQRFDTMDKVALLIAAFLATGGLFTLLFPQDMVFGRATNYPKNRQETLLEHITPSQARWYGLGAILGGAGLASYILWATRAS